MECFQRLQHLAMKKSEEFVQHAQDYIQSEAEDGEEGEEAALIASEAKEKETLRTQAAYQ